MGDLRLTDLDHTASWPAALKKAAKSSQPSSTESWEPEIIKMSTRKAADKLSDLLSQVHVTQVVDNYDEQLAELFISKNAHLYKASLEVKRQSIADYLVQHYGSKPPWQMGSWVYYPWNGQLVHVLREDLFWELRTIRNKNLINAEEQQAFANFKAGCLGMSVGSNGAVALVLQGGSKQIKLADGAVLSGSNLNRIRTGVGTVGLNKAVVIARQLYEMNPYIEVDITQSKIRPENINAFFEKPWPLDVVIDEIDDLEMKIRLRVEARRRRLPVLMVTDPGDDAMLDVERFDLNPNLPLFHGLAGKIEEVLDKKDLNQREFIKYATMIIGTENLSLRLQESMMQVGSKLPTQPQLGGAATMAGSVVAFAVRQLAIGGPLKSGRRTLSMEKTFLAGMNSPAKRLKHHRHTRRMNKALKSI